MSRKVFAACLSLAAVFFIIIFTFCGRFRQQPSILLITLDTTRTDHLSCYGYHRQTTPNLDRLAREGQVFERCYAVSSWTLPTHASLFTGLYPSTHGAHFSESGEISLEDILFSGNDSVNRWYLADRLPDDALTLAEILRNAGYTTGGVGSGPWLKPVFGLDQGFDFYDCRVHSPRGRRADRVNPLALRFIRRHADRPFFLFLNYFDPHDPREPPAAFMFKFFPKSRAHEARSDPETAEAFIIARYDAEIFFVDLQIGLVLDALRRLDIYDNTCIIVVNDHGEHLGDHDLWGHGHSLFEGVVRSPMIVKWPAGWKPIPAEKQECQHVDIMPTLLDRLDIEAPVPLEGDILGQVEHPVVCELFRNIGQIRREGPRYDRHLTAIFQDRYKLILSSKEGDPDAGLFDLERDPGEELDISAAQADRAAAMKDRLDQWRRALQAPLAPEKIESVDPRTREQLEALGYTQ
jgi:arylsulfatase A-like enzyme